MFKRFAKIIQNAIPLSSILASYYFTLNTPFMAIEHNDKSSKLIPSTTYMFRKNHPRIKFVRDIANYAQNLLVRGRSIILCELTGDKFIDDQVISLAQQFVSHHQQDISLDFQFIFLEKSNISNEYADENYFVIYGLNGEKIINIDNYLNKNREKVIKLNARPIMKRLIQSLNVYKEVGLDNIRKQLNLIDIDNNYTAIYTASKENYNTNNAIKLLKSFEKEYSVKARSLNKFVVKDEQTRTIFGLKNTNDERVYLLAPDNSNLKKKFRQKTQFFTINGKRFTNIDVLSNNLNQIFVFPPIQNKINPTDFVLNVYINKNKNYQQIQQSIYKQLSKPQYQKLQKAIYYTNDVQQAAIYYEQNDYSAACLLAYQKEIKLQKNMIKDLLSHTFQYQFLINSNEGLNGEKLQQWVRDCKEIKVEQYFQSQKIQQVWAQPITGEEYKQIRDEPSDKVIYHYSQHCHGCKKFGGKFEQFAKNKSLNHPNINFYRINNDNNKVEGVKNYNSTPIFVFYKKCSSNPFLYKMPIFTEQLFDNFLKITSEVKLIPISQLESHINERNSSSNLMNELLADVKI